MDSVSIIFEDDPTPVILTEAAVNYFELVKDLSVISTGPINVGLKKNIFNKILEFGEINNFKPLKVASIKTNDLKQALQGDEKNYNYIAKYKGSEDPQLSELFRAAEFIKCQSLLLLIAVVVGCELYFGDSLEKYQQVKKRLGVTTDITFEEDEEYSRNYVYMN